MCVGSQTVGGFCVFLFFKVGAGKERQKFVFGRLTQQSWESGAGRGCERILRECPQTEPRAGGPLGDGRLVTAFCGGSEGGRGG